MNGAKMPSTETARVYRFPLNGRPRVEIPFVTARVCAGFPSPADDHLEEVLDLNELCITQPAATFLVRAGGISMTGGVADIHDGDVLVVNRAKKPAHKQIVVACVDGEFCVKRLMHQNQIPWLMADNPNSPALRLDTAGEVTIWGVVTWIFREV